MNRQRIFAVFVARNREFYRDKAGFGWNVVMPVLLLVGFMLIFSNPQEALFKIGVLGDPAGTPLAELRHVQQIPQVSEAEALEKLRYHRLDLVVDLRDKGRGDRSRYWVNEESPQGYAAERVLIAGAIQSSGAWQREGVSGQAIRYVDWLAPGILGMNIMFSALWGVGWVIVRYRKNGVLRRLRATPLTAGEFLIAQVLSRLVVVVSVNVFIITMAQLLLDIPMRGSYLALFLVFLAGALSLISMGLVIATRLRSEEVASGLLDLIAFPMMVLSGVWFSLEGLNVWVQRISELMPLTHIVDAARRIMLDGAGLADVALEIGVLFTISLVLLTFSARVFRWQ